jgi:hypothetical protein
MLLGSDVSQLPTEPFIPDKGYGKSSSCTGLDGVLGFQDVEAPTFLDNRHMKVVRLSALHTGRLYLPGNITVTHFC